MGWDGIDYGRKDPCCASAVGSVLLSGCGCVTNCVLICVAMSCLIKFIFLVEVFSFFV